MEWMDAKQMLLQMYAKVDVGFVVDDVDDKTMQR